MGSARLPRPFAWGKPPAHVRAWRRCSYLLCLVQVPVVFKRALNARLHALRIIGFIHSCICRRYFVLELFIVVDGTADVAHTFGSRTLQCNSRRRYGRSDK